MSSKLIRVYHFLDITAIKSQLLIYGDLTGSCANCQQIDVAIDAIACPACKAKFKYVSFRNIKSHYPKALKMIQDRPEVVLVDFEDYQKNLGAHKAQEFLK